MNETIIVDNKQLGEMLGITESSVRKIISRGILEESLNNKGYKLIRRFKQGRKYVCEIEKADSCMEILYGIAKGMFNTDMIKEWGDYMLYRNANEDLPLSKNTLSELCNIHRNTITKWDKKMIENNFMSNDGCFYIVKVYNPDGSVKGYELTDYREYKNYHSTNYKYKRMKKDIVDRYANKEITYDEYEMQTQAINDYLISNEGKFVYRISKYSIERDNKLYNEIFELIKMTFEDKNKEYRQKWLEGMDESWRVKEYELQKEAKKFVDDELNKIGINAK